MSRNNQQERAGGGGFRSMLNAAFKSSNKEIEHPYVPTTGFGRMLEAAELGGRQNVVESTVVSQKEKAVSQNFGGGFHAMLDSAFPEGKRRIIENENKVDEAFLVEKVKQMETRILSRISEMPPKKPKRLQKQPTNRGFGQGFCGMLDNAFPPSRRVDQCRIEPLEDGETIMFYRGFFDKGLIARKGNKLITTFLPT